MILHPLRAALLASAVSALNLDINSEESIKDAAGTVSFNMMTNYTANHTGEIPGKLPGTWWRGAILYNTLIDYWHFTDDASNNPAVTQGLNWQRGDNDNYMPANYSSYLGNDDQLAWGLAAMSAAELNFPQEDSMPEWSVLAANVFDTLVPRWDTKSCNGGLRWQIYPYQAGYATKNALSNGGMFELAARLARYTGNQTYADWAEKVWDWSVESSLVNNKTWVVGDSMQVEDECGNMGHIQLTANYKAYLNGAAYMFNMTNGTTTKWKSGVDGLLDTTFDTFFPKKYDGKVLSEVVCEPPMNCDADQDTFKGSLVSALAFTSQLVPHTADTILAKLESSAEAAAKQCSGGKDKTLCGRRWYQDKWDGTSSMEEDMSATNLFAANLVRFQGENKGLATAETSASSSDGNTTDGSDSSDDSTNSTGTSHGDIAETNGSGHLGVSGLVVGETLLTRQFRMPGSLQPSLQAGELFRNY
ncbi:hypothetical protein FE257_005313 [Aspergillus nanangensis]|uniref:Mannan endo-1,6-alpha-mannosidase n=1 Tax=Aspergillus nanangensis TaxID=2582783 RepID=A0AAD4CAB0_ASPNN|nr:hypothetical protein FE257_005313 [Aspergillus nanangensis]